MVTFSGYWNKSRLVLRLPVILFNSGARPRVITALRLVTTDDKGKRIVLECHSFRKTIDPTSEDMEDMAHAYAIPARQVVTKHAHFAVDSLPVFNQAEPASFQVQALVDDSTNWRKVGDVMVHVEIIYTSSYITYSNNPGVWPANLQDDAAGYRALLYGAEAMPLDAHGNSVH
ncbi:hypothetical protein [Arthrobacter sp. U41]|uniref:hypothetical protein n=1 Tax=Arthrobacter sp. U41 TaxID=1849032 RepID=UPI00085961CE|nr:hypothetical protein [Arthrobacter sp. U41]AOT05774.1 hypothetical protein ASPU41_20210 [Arthrobacter sp. U41]